MPFHMPHATCHVPRATPANVQRVSKQSATGRNAAAWATLLCLGSTCKATVECRVVYGCLSPGRGHPRKQQMS